MYNEQQKQRYIEYRKPQKIWSSIYYLDNMFNNTEEMEINLGKDICSFSAKEIISFYKSLGYTSVQMLRNMNSELRNYVKWCMDNNIINDLQNHFDETASHDILSKCINSQITNSSMLNRKQIMEICNAGYIKNASDKFIILGLFEGLEGKHFEDLLLAKSVDFDHLKLVYHCSNGKDFHITETLYSYAEESWKEEYYYSEKERAYKYKEDNHCIKSYREIKSDTDHSKTIRINKRINMIFGNVDIDGVLLSDFMTAHKLYESGMIEYCKEIMKKNKESFYDFVYSEHFEKDMKIRHYQILQGKKYFYTKYSTYLE